MRERERIRDWELGIRNSESGILENWYRKTGNLEIGIRTWIRKQDMGIRHWDSRIRERGFKNWELGIGSCYTKKMHKSDLHDCKSDLFLC